MIFRFTDEIKKKKNKKIQRLPTTSIIIKIWSRNTGRTEGETIKKYIIELR